MMITLSCQRLQRQFELFVLQLLVYLESLLPLPLCSKDVNLEISGQFHCMSTMLYPVYFQCLLPHPGQKYAVKVLSAKGTQPGGVGDALKPAKKTCRTTAARPRSPSSPVALWTIPQTSSDICPSTRIFPPLPPGIFHPFALASVVPGQHLALVAILVSSWHITCLLDSNRFCCAGRQTPTIRGLCIPRTSPSRVCSMCFLVSLCFTVITSFVFSFHKTSETLYLRNIRHD